VGQIYKKVETLNGFYSKVFMSVIEPALLPVLRCQTCNFRLIVLRESMSYCSLYIVNKDKSNMGEVVLQGTKLLSEEDRKAMAIYLLDDHQGG